MKGLRFPESFHVDNNGYLGKHWYVCGNDEYKEVYHLSIIGGGILDDDGINTFEMYDQFEMEDPQRGMTADDINAYLKDKYGA